MNEETQNRWQSDLLITINNPHRKNLHLTDIEVLDKKIIKFFELLIQIDRKQNNND